MKSIARSVLLSTALLATACSKETNAAGQATPPVTPSAAGQPAAQQPQTPPAPAAAPTVADLGKLLGGIQDAATAAAAKLPLDAIVQQLQTAKNAVPAAASSEALGGLGKLASDAAAKLGVSPEITKQITTLLDTRASRP